MREPVIARLVRVAIVAVVAVVALWPGIVLAQQIPLPPYVLPTRRDDPQQLQMPRRAPLTIVPSVTVAEEYNDNVNLSNANRESDFITIIQPGLSPLRPASPNIPLNTLLAAALGLVFGSGMVLLLGRGSIEDETAGGFTRRRSWFGSRQAVRPPAVDAGRSVSQPPTVPAAAQSPTSGPPAVAPSTGGVAQPGGTLATGYAIL